MANQLKQGIKAGRSGIRDFAGIDKTSTPTQQRDLPHEGDPYCGNDNNRRAHLRKLKAQAEADPENFDGEAATAALGGEERIKKAIKGHRDLGDVTAPSGEIEDENDEGDLSLTGEKNNAQTGTQGDDPGAETGSQTNTEGTQDQGEPKKPVTPPKPSSAPAWKPNA